MRTVTPALVLQITADRRGVRRGLTIRHHYTSVVSMSDAGSSVSCSTLIDPVEECRFECQVWIVPAADAAAPPVDRRQVLGRRMMTW